MALIISGTGTISTTTAIPTDHNGTVIEGTSHTPTTAADAIGQLNFDYDSGVSTENVAGEGGTEGWEAIHSFIEVMSNAWTCQPRAAMKRASEMLAAMYRESLQRV